MKKIIDLIEKYFELDDNAPVKDAVEARDKWADTIWHIEQEIGDMVARRRKLEATPITEEWLKVHGFVKNEYRGWEYDLVMDDGRTEIRYYRSGGEPESTMSIYKNIDYENEVCYEVPEPYTLADLYDACELCGINLEV